MMFSPPVPLNFCIHRQNLQLSKCKRVNKMSDTPFTFFRKRVKITPKEWNFIPKKSENQSVFTPTQECVVSNSTLSRVKILLSFLSERVKFSLFKELNWRQHIFEWEWRVIDFHSFWSKLSLFWSDFHSFSSEWSITRKILRSYETLKFKLRKYLFVYRVNFNLYACKTECNNQTIAFSF